MWGRHLDLLGIWIKSVCNGDMIHLHLYLYLLYIYKYAYVCIYCTIVYIHAYIYICIYIYYCYCILLYHTFWVTKKWFTFMPLSVAALCSRIPRKRPEQLRSTRVPLPDTLSPQADEQAWKQKPRNCQLSLLS